MSPFTDPLINTHASVRSDVFRPPSPRTCTLIPPCVGDRRSFPVRYADRTQRRLLCPSVPRVPLELVIPGTDAFSNTFLTVPSSEQLLDQANASLTMSVIRTYPQIGSTYPFVQILSPLARLKSIHSPCSNTQSWIGLTGPLTFLIWPPSLKLRTNITFTRVPSRVIGVQKRQMSRRCTMLCIIGTSC